MFIRKYTTAAILALTALFVSVSGAMAYQAAASTSLNVRSGPGTNYGVVGVLQTNQVVDVLECNASNTWCRIQDRTTRGWASARYLQPISGGAPSRPGAGGPNFGVTIGGDGFSFSFGTGPRSQVCFYEAANYRGSSFCARPGNTNRFLDRGWRNRITSIRIDGNAQATICTQPGLRGHCVTVDRSVRHLGRLSNTTASYRIR